MAVMNKMRSMTSIILYTLILAFIGTIIFSWGMNYTGRSVNTTAVGEVDGVEIDAKQFDAAFARQMDQYRQQAGGEIADAQRTFIRNQVWEAMIRDVLIRKELTENEIVAADAEIVYRLFNDPPEILKTNPSFLNEQKQFDMAIYQAAINDPSLAEQWAPIESYLRDNLPFEKFQQRLLATVRITEEEIMREYLKNNQNAKVQYIFVDPKVFSSEDIKIEDASVEEYYNQHQEDYKQSEQRAIEYVLLSTKATALDSVNTEAEANRLLQRAKDGEDFAEIAETYSEDQGSRDKGGDLGYFGKGAMVKSFEEAAFAAAIGDVVGPVESQFGLHIIKIEDKRLSKKDEKGKRNEEVKARHILLKYEASRKTLNRIRDDADYLADKATSGSFEELAKETDGTIKKSGLFTKGSGFVPGLGLNTRISNFVFRGRVGDVGPVEETNDGLIVFKVAEIQSDKIKTLDEVRLLITNKLTSEAQMDKAGDLAQKIYTEVQGGVDFEKIAEQDSVDTVETDPFNRAGFVTSVGRDPGFIGAAFSLQKVGDISSPVKGTRGYYILKLLEKSEFISQDFLVKRLQVETTLKQRKENEAFSNWYAGAKARAEVKDYRDSFYN